MGNGARRGTVDGPTAVEERAPQRGAGEVRQCAVPAPGNRLRDSGTDRRSAGEHHADRRGAAVAAGAVFPAAPRPAQGDRLPALRAPVRPRQRRGRGGTGEPDPRDPGDQPQFGETAAGPGAAVPGDGARGPGGGRVDGGRQVAAAGGGVQPDAGTHLQRSGEADRGIGTVPGDLGVSRGLRRALRAAHRAAGARSSARGAVGARPDREGQSHVARREREDDAAGGPGGQAAARAGGRPEDERADRGPGSGALSICETGWDRAAWGWSTRSTTCGRGRRWR